MRGAANPAQALRPGVSVRLAYRDFHREIALPPAIAAVLFALVPAVLLATLGVGFYLMFRDDMLASLMRRQASMQFAYEDRIAALRSQIDSIASRQMVNQDTFEGKMAELAVRQAKLESRSALLSSLAARVDPQDAPAARRAATAEPAAPISTLAPSAAPAPVPTLGGAPRDNFKPAPEGFDLRRAQPSGPVGEDVSDNSDQTSPDQRLRSFAARFDRIEQRQIAALNGLKAPAAAKAERMREAFAEAGLPVDRMIRQAAATPGKDGTTTAPMGGPFVPATAPERGGEFERAYASLHNSIAAMDGLRRALPFAPLRQPLPGPLDVTSTYGYRTDPFLGRPALHTGMDFRGDYGEPVRATAAGRVVSAGPAGGYGNMVEIDHGAGLATRYGHLSRIFVEEGQWISAGSELGAVGSTGRSTGPHLHYEVRVDGAPVDPSRYIKAGRLLNAGL
ncbi:M23 family metallopeptidase [Rhodoblastus sp.]|uniref:M23 family metallopeptidase n=1 Tax=Rhodoblastus sp. TaxID=1962975 RepID=UPI0035B40B9A